MLISDNGKVLTNDSKILALSETPPKLYTPIISIWNDEITIKNPKTNGNFAIDCYITIPDSETMGNEEMKLVDSNGVFIDEYTRQFIIYIRSFFPQGEIATTYNLKARFKSEKFIDSDYQSVSFTRYLDDSGVSVTMEQAFESPKYATLYYRRNNDFNVTFTRDVGVNVNEFQDIHKMEFYFEHPKLIGVKQAILSYYNANTNSDVTQSLDVTVIDGRTNVIHQVIASGCSYYYYQFEFIFDESDTQ